MMDSDISFWRGFRSMTGTISIGVAAFVAGTPDGAMAHSFIVKLDATAVEPPVLLGSAIQGMRLAAGERDSHAAETSDGHLGGIDLFVRVQPSEAAKGITWLKGAPVGVALIVVDFSLSDSAAARVADDGVIIIGPGALPTDEVWSTDMTAASDSFVARFQFAYGSVPDRQAAQGYTIARRIDRALRDSEGVQDIAGLLRALDLSAEGIVGIE